MWCYCGSALMFSDCCQPLLAGINKAATALQLMRSRYSAYCTGNINYIANTYHPSQHSDNAIAEIAAFAKAAHFIALTILPQADHPATGLPNQSDTGQAHKTKTDKNSMNTTQSPSAAAPHISEGTVDYVHFIARFIMQDKLQQLEERSRFVFEQQQWWYLDGMLFPHAVNKINRNDSCPCGSGKKYKVCRPHLMSGQS